MVSDEAWWDKTFAAAVYLERTVLQRVHENMIARQTSELGPSDIATLRSKAALASVLKDDKVQLPEARALAEEAAAGLVAQLGDGHEDALRVQTVLAQMLEATHEFDQAQTLYAGIVEQLTRLFGVEDDRTLRVKRHLAGLFCKVGKLQTARKLYEEVEEVQSASLGNAHPDSLLTRGSLATLLVQLDASADREAGHKMLAQVALAYERLDHPT
eukprot:COSAG02_NODE_1684_length_11324_cov_8.190111_7_plen_214_part_00